MIRPLDESTGPNPSRPPNDDDERVGEAIEAYLGLIEKGEAPDPEHFAAQYPGVEEDVRAALQGLELVNGLVGHLPGSTSTGSSGRPGGGGRFLESGRRIAGYRIVRELGRGGMGTVYEAVHIALDRPVAFKILGTHAAPDSSARRRFLNEARTTARLHHTNIVPVFDVGQVGGLCYYAMQRIEGTGLDRILRRQRRGLAQSGFGQERVPSSPDNGGARGISASNSSHSSRLGQLWIRVSAGWLKRPPSRDPIRNANGNGEASRPQGNAGNASARGSDDQDNGRGFSASVLAGVESTGSWNGQLSATEMASRSRSLSGSRAETRLGSAPKTGDLVSGRVDDDEEEPHFFPPKGSAVYRWIAEVGLQAAEALAHAHHQGVIHRDIKPSNLLIDAKGTVWVTDFGLARRLADPGLTQHDSLLGTPRYMSPEQSRPGPIDGRSDLFSLGATLYELMTLRPAFDGRSAAELVDQIAHLDPPPLRSIDSRIPRDLETIVLKLLAKRPGDRYASAASLAEDLARFLNHEPVKARRISPVGRLWRVARRHPGITGVSTVAAATILAVATHAHVRVVNALGKSEKANQLYLDQLRTSHWQNAALVRLSPNLLERRARGLDLIQKAAKLNPEPELKRQLRDEAVDFLSLRDVEKSGELITGRLRGLQFDPANDRVVMLGESTGPEPQESLDFWNIKTHQREKSIPLGSGRGWYRWGRTSMTVAGRTIAVILPTDRGRMIDTAFETALANFYATNSVALALGGFSPIATAHAHEQSSRLATLPGDRGIRLFDAENGEHLRDLMTPIRNVIGVFGAPVGDRLVTLDLEGQGRPWGIQRRFHVNLWNLKEPDQPPIPLDLPGREMPPSPNSNAMICLGFSPDGQKLAIGWGSAIGIYSATDGESLGLIDTQTQINTLAIGPNDVLAAAGGGNLRLWDIESLAFLSSLTPTQNAIASMRFSPRGSLLALVGRDDATVELVDPVGRSTVAFLRTTEKVSEVTFSSDGEWLLAGGRDATTALVWKLLDSTTRLQFSGFDQPVSAMSFRKDGLLAVGTNGGEIWGCGIGTASSSASCTPLVSDPSTRTEPSATTPGTMAGSADRENRTGRSGSPGLEMFPIGVAVRPEEPISEREQRGNRERYQPITLAYDDRDRLVIDHETQAIRTILKAGTEDASSFPFVSLPVWRDREINGFRASSTLSRAGDGSLFLVSRGGRYSLWRPDSPDTLQSIEFPRLDRDSTSTAETAGSRTGARETTKGSASSKGNSNVTPGSQSQQNPPATTKGSRQGGGGRFGGPRFSSARLSADGRRMYAIASTNNFDPTGMPQAWDLWDEGDHLRTSRIEWPTAPSEISTMALSQDGNLLALGNRTGRVVLVETRGLRIVGQIEPSVNSEGPVQAIVFSPNGSELALASHHGPIVISQLRRAKPDPKSTFELEPTSTFRLPVLRSPVRHLTFDAQGNWLACSGSDPVVEAWNIQAIRHEFAKLGLDD